MTLEHIPCVTLHTYVICYMLYGSHMLHHSHMLGCSHGLHHSCMLHCSCMLNHSHRKHCSYMLYCLGMLYRSPLMHSSNVLYHLYIIHWSHTLHHKRVLPHSCRLPLWIGPCRIEILTEPKNRGPFLFTSLDIVKDLTDAVVNEKRSRCRRDTIIYGMQSIVAT